MALTHSQIRSQLLSLVMEAGESMIGYGFMRVLETMIDIAQHEGSANTLATATLPALERAQLDASTAGPFEVINYGDTRTVSQICHDQRLRGIDCSLLKGSDQ